MSVCCGVLDTQFSDVPLSLSLFRASVGWFLDCFAASRRLAHGLTLYRSSGSQNWKVLCMAIVFGVLSKSPGQVIKPCEFGERCLQPFFRGGLLLRHERPVGAGFCLTEAHFPFTGYASYSEQ